MEKSNNLLLYTMFNNFKKLSIEEDNVEKFEERIIKRYKMPLLVLKVNYPGVNRSNDITNNIIENIDELLSDIFSLFIHFKMLRITWEGPTLMMAIDKEANDIKKITVQIEEKHILGKCVNIEVFDTNNEKVRREKLGYGPRKCCICDKNAEECTELNNHKRDEIIQYIVNKYREYMESFHGKKDQ